MSEPRILLLDEPSLGLAPNLVKQIFDTVGTLARTGLTVLLVEQNARLALRLADHAYVLKLGRIVRSGSGRDLLDDDEVARAYLGRRRDLTHVRSAGTPITDVSAPAGH